MSMSSCNEVLTLSDTISSRVSRDSKRQPWAFVLLALWERAIVEKGARLETLCKSDIWEYTRKKQLLF
jgi:hypothetical protein